MSRPVAIPGAVVVALLVTGLIGAPGGSAAVAPSPTTVHTADGRELPVFGAGKANCMKVTSQRWVLPAQSKEVTAAEPDAATVVEFADQSGTVGEQRIAPAAWRPLKTSDEELAFYGYDARPSDPTALAGWRAQAARFTGFSPPGMCSRPDIGSISSFANAKTQITTFENTAFNAIWSGIVNHSGSITKSYARQVIGSNSSFPCASGAHSAWVGIGGYSTGRLMQNGILQYSGGAFAWYEVLNGSYTPALHTVNLGVAPGQTLNISTEYFPSTNKVQFGFNNLSTGVSASTAILSSVDGHPPSYYYDGQDGEVIDERPLQSGQVAPLRNYNRTVWSNAVYYQSGGSTSHPIRSGPEDGIVMQSNAATTLSSPNGAGYPLDGFEDNFYACG